MKVWFTDEYMLHSASICKVFSSGQYYKEISDGKFSHFDMIENSLMISMGAVEYGLSV